MAWCPPALLPASRLVRPCRLAEGFSCPTTAEGFPSAPADPAEPPEEEPRTGRDEERRHRLLAGIALDLVEPALVILRRLVAGLPSDTPDVAACAVGELSRLVDGTADALPGFGRVLYSLTGGVGEVQRLGLRLSTQRLFTGDHTVSTILHGDLLSKMALPSTAARKSCATSSVERLSPMLAGESSRSARVRRWGDVTMSCARQDDGGCPGRQTSDEELVGR